MLLFGGSTPPRPTPIQIDPSLPQGPQFAARLVRPVDDPARRACSFRQPVCVHAGPHVSSAVALAALGGLEQAYERLVDVLELPPPRADGGRGGTDALDLYLSAGGRGELVTDHDPPAPTPFDSAPAFCELGQAAHTPLDRAATLCVGEAIAWRLDASTTPYERRAYAEELWLVTGRPTSLDAEAVADLQAHPELGIAGFERSPLSAGAAVFFEYLDVTRGAAQPAWVPTALFSAAASKTPPGAWQWHDRPDVFDVLRHTTGDNAIRMADLMGDFAVARAFLGSRDDGTHLPSLEWTGDFGRVRFDWKIPFSSLPRRVESTRPLEPTGSIYVWLALDHVPAGATLGFRADWEPPVAFKWSLVRIGRDGRELGRIDVPFQERATHVEAQMIDLKGAGVIAVGTNLGGVDPDHPFDPDVAPYEPHGCTVYLARL